MKIEELFEYKIHNIVDNRARTSVKVIENPGKIQFMNLLYDNKNRNHVVRGLVVNDDIYIWIAYYATHFTVKQFLTMQGVDGEFIFFLLEIDDNDPNVDAKIWIYGNDSGNHNELYQHPAFKRMTRNLTIGKWE